MSDLHAALQALNRAAYAAQAAYIAAYPESPGNWRRRGSEYARILDICAATDKLVDDNAPGIKREAAG